MSDQDPGPPTIEHTGHLEDLTSTPGWIIPPAAGIEVSLEGRYSCAYCGVGDSATVRVRKTVPDAKPAPPAAQEGILRLTHFGQVHDFKALLRPDGHLEVHDFKTLGIPGDTFTAELRIGEKSQPVVARWMSREKPTTTPTATTVEVPQATTTRRDLILGEGSPSTGCVKLKISMGQQSPVFPIHLAPSVLPEKGGPRRTVPYTEGIERLAELLLAHRPPHGRTLVYACGQVDYFTIFAFQEVFRLLGVRNMSGNAEHCLNAGAVHNEILTGQEGPFLTLEQALEGPGRFYMLNGWNGFVSHPPAFHQLLKRKDLDAYLVEVAVTESARALAEKLGPERILLIRPGSDPHLALAVAHQIFKNHPEAVSSRFVERFADAASFEAYRELATSEFNSPERAVGRIAAEPSYLPRLLEGIRRIAERFCAPDVIPINIPSVGLSQTKGAVSHCLWGNAMATVGKYGLAAEGKPAGGTLRIPGQINAQTEVQGLSRNVFLGRIRMTPEGVVDAARRMGLPDDHYQPMLAEQVRAALDYGDPVEDRPELFICFGTQFESNMPGRTRWIKKLKDAGTTLVVVDPIPDPFSVAHADLILPSPPHVAATKVYQNGEWRYTLSVPRKRAAPEVRTDATICYDTMAIITRRLVADAGLRAKNPDLVKILESGYLSRRFLPPSEGGGLERVEGEVSRPELWGRVQDYMAGTPATLGPLYCRPEHADGKPISWESLVTEGSILSGGVGVNRYRLDYEDGSHIPFRDIYRRPGKFRFFVPKEEDLSIPSGIILNSGRSTMSDDRRRVRFAIQTFNSGKATPATDMPLSNPLYLSLALAQRLGIGAGDRVRVEGVESGSSLVFDAEPTDRLKGDVVYVSFHKSKAEIEQGQYLNELTSHKGRCPYTSQSSFKTTIVNLERVSGPVPSPVEPEVGS